MNAYLTQTAVLRYEPLIENTVDTFLRELEHRFVKDNGNEASFDVYTWISYFTFDVMGKLTYSKRHGFIARGEDVHGIISWVEKFVAYGNVVSSFAIKFPCASCERTDLLQVGQMPLVDSLFRHNPVLMWLEKRG